MRNIRIAPREDWVTKEAPVSSGRRQMRRATDWLATGLIGLLIPALLLPFLGAAAAEVTTTTLAVDPSSARPGTAVVVTGTGFGANEKGVLIIDADELQLADYRANAKGRLRLKITIPKTVPVGAYTLTAQDMAQTRRATVAFKVVAPSPSPTPAPTATPAPTTTPAPTATPAPTPEPTVDPTAVPTPGKTNSPSASPAPSDPPGPVGTPTPAPTDTGVPTPTPVPTPVPVPVVTPTPTAAATPTPVASPSPTPSPTPTAPTVNGYYVSNSGNDANSGTMSQPLRTLQRAADVVPAGATVFVRAGEYVGFTMTRSGTTFAPVTFTNYPGETAIVRGDATHTNVVKVSGAHDVTIRGLTITGAPAQWGAGVLLQNGAYRVIVEGNTLTGNRSFGVKLQSVGQVTVRDNDIFDNETGIEISGGGSGVVIAANRIHDHNRMVVNTVGGDDDRGANAIVFYRSSGPTTVVDNLIWNNRATSYDYGTDGEAFNIYAASGIWFEGNHLWNNEAVLETGTDGADCANNTFVRNTASGGLKTGSTMGMILRCARNMLVANNTYYDLDSFVFDVNGGATAFGGSIEGLRILNNVARQLTSRVYSIDSALPSSVQIDNGLVSNASGGSIAYVAGKGNTASLDTFQVWTGRELSGIQADPAFVAPGSADFRLKSTSPAIDHALYISGVTGPYAGDGPDIGGYEYGG